MKMKLYNQEGTVVGDVELPSAIFEVSVNPDVIHQVIVAQEANARVALAHTKTRGEVRGGGKKPWRQKGTGRARHGSIRSPLWVGGGITFGPRSNRNFSQKVNQKMKRKALKMALSDKASSDAMVILDQLTIDAPKSKTAASLLAKLPTKGGTTLVVLPDSNSNVIKSFRNIPTVKTIRADSLNVGDLLTYQYVLLPKASLTVVEKIYT
jgi:large subunit ribosomal protein L4